MTVMRPDLRRATRKLEDLMQDECVVTRDLEGTADDTFDDDTGLYTRPTGDDTTIYTGKCFINPTGIGSAEDSEMSVTRNPGYRTLAAYLPVATVDVLENDYLVVTSSLRDSGMVGRKMRVVGVRFTSFAVARRLDLEDVR